MSPTNYREQMTCDFKSILSEMCKFNPVWSEKDQAGPCWGGWWGQAGLSVHGIGISRAPGPGWDRAGDKLSSSLAQGWLRVQGWAELQPRVLELWVVVPGGAGQGCPEHPGLWENSPVQRAGLEWLCWGVLSSEALPQCPGALWKWLPAVLTLCTGSAVSDHGQNQSWKRPTRSSSPALWRWFRLTRIWLWLTRWHLLTKLTF